MSTEVAALALTGLLGALHLVALSLAANLTMPTRWLVGPRDAPRDLPVLAGRLNRAFENHLQALALFTAAVVAVELGDAHSSTTATAAQVYLAARLVYGPVYAAGLPWVRSIVWFVGFAATVILLTAALLAG